MNNFWNVWNANGEIKIGNYTLQGFSVAGFRTNFYIKELSIMLDAGISSPYSPTHIFVTHSHSDHIASIPFHLLSQNKEKKFIYCPASQVRSIDEYIRTLFTTNNGGCDTWDDRKNHETIGVRPYTFMDLTIGKKEYLVEVIKCYHSIDSVGYGFITKTRRFKKQLKTRPSIELKKLSNHEKYDWITKCEFCYLGDTSCEILKEDMIYCYDSIIIECSFIYDSELERSVQTQHIHWTQLKPYVVAHPKIMFYLYHFSMRYKSDEIIEFFNNQHLDNIVVLANHNGSQPNRITAAQGNNNNNVLEV